MRALCENYLHREAGKLRSGRLRKQTLERLVYPAVGDIPLADPEALAHRGDARRY